MAKVLVTRLSSFGDVALLVPVIYSVASRYPQDRFVVMTRQAFSPLFSYLGFNISVMPLDMRKRHCGVTGLLRLMGKAHGKGFTHVADVHDVLRTKALRYSMRLTLTKTAKIDKGRAEKNLMILEKDTSVFLKHTTERYFDVFRKLGFPAEMTFDNFFDFKPRDFNLLRNVVTEKCGQWIGIAPFAKHEGKVYPMHKMEELISTLSKRENTSIFLFGAGKEEVDQISKWVEKYPNIINHEGKLNLELELLLISYLDVMVSMDSANMHLASLVKVPVVSIWGATHPALGFYGFNQDIDNAIQLDIKCRPCSVFGDLDCPFTGEDKYKCMNQIDNKDIVNKIEKVLG